MAISNVLFLLLLCGAILLSLIVPLAAPPLALPLFVGLALLSVIGIVIWTGGRRLVAIAFLLAFIYGGIYQFKAGKEVQLKVQKAKSRK